MARMASKDYDEAVKFVTPDCEYTNLPMATVRGPQGVHETLEPFFAPIEQNEMIWCLSSFVYDLAPEMTRRSVLAGLVAWFLLDSAGSIASGNPSNAAFNVVVLAAAAGPMWWPAKA